MTLHLLQLHQASMIVKQTHPQVLEVVRFSINFFCPILSNFFSFEVSQRYVQIEFCGMFFNFRKSSQTLLIYLFISFLFILVRLHLPHLPQLPHLFFLCFQGLHPHDLVVSFINHRKIQKLQPQKKERQQMKNPIILKMSLHLDQKSQVLHLLWKDLFLKKIKILHLIHQQDKMVL